MSAKCHEPDIARVVEKEGAAAPSGDICPSPNPPRPSGAMPHPFGVIVEVYIRHPT